MKTVETTTSYTPLPLAEKSREGFVLAFNQRVIKDDPLIYEYDIATCEGELTYENVLKAIINARYSQDDVTAIMLNLMDADIAPAKYNEYRKEAGELHDWRAMAKKVAKQVILNKEKENGTSK